MLRKAGWDTHGLPVELEVEKQLGLDGKEQIEQYGHGAVYQEVQGIRMEVQGHVGRYVRPRGLLGWIWMHPYVTYDDNYIESEWWSAEGDLPRRACCTRAIRSCPIARAAAPRCPATRSAQGYKAVKERSAVVRFKVKDEENTYIYAWTTTPWTLSEQRGAVRKPDRDLCKV